MGKREILFRGKRTNNGEWIEGFYYKMSETTYAFAEDYKKHPVPVHHYILFERMTDWGLPNQMYQVEVDPDTIGQDTGSTDKNGRKIFEGDIVKVVDKSRENKIFDIGNVSFEEGSWKLCGEIMHWLEDVISFEFEIIGNIIDNPELLDSGGKPE